MKKINFLWLIAILVFTSCTQDEVFYSCDSEVDQWTKERLADIKTMKRTDWLEVEGEDYQRAIYNAFDPEQKYLFWKEKLAEVLKLEWNPEEKKHIELLSNYIDKNPKIFDRASFDKDSFDKFMYSWLEKARDEFEWDDSVLYAIAISGETMADTNGTIKAKITMRATPPTKAKTECSCNKSRSVCFVAGWSCKDPYTCTKVSDGCGLLNLEECNGNCTDK